MSSSARLNRLGAALLCLCHCASPLSPAPRTAPTPAPGVQRAASPRGASAELPAPPEETLDQTRRRLLEEQDTDCDQRITRADQGSRSFRFRWQDQPYEMSGGYVLSNLLEELNFALKYGQAPELPRVMEDPISRVSRVLGNEGWNALSRQVDEEGLPSMLEATTSSSGPARTLYVPADDAQALGYFSEVAARYNGAYRRLAGATANLSLLDTLSDASSSERSRELVALLRTPEGRRSLAQLLERLAGIAQGLGHRSLSVHLGRALERARELAARAELACVQSSDSRLSRLAQSLGSELGVFRPHELLTQALPDTPPTAPARPGLLSLALRETGTELTGVPFIAASGRAEQLNGWGSYFALLGLLQDHRPELARGLVDNLVYEVEHYHQSLPANRSYALTRSQPPFLASMVRALWQATPAGERDRRWLERALDAALLEYKNLWGRASRQVSSLCRGSGEERVCLARHAGEGSGQPPEAEPGHFDWLWQGLGRSLEPSYRTGQLKQRDLGAELELAFRNERCMGESGHADTQRWFWPAQATPGQAPPVNRCSDMVSVDLNSLLYKYEVDLAWLGARLAELDGAGSGGTPPRAPEARLWCGRAKQRFALMKQHLWSPRDGLFYDAFVSPSGPVMTGYVSATTLYPLWATAEACEGSSAAQSPLSTQERSALVTNALAQLEAPGGLLAGSRASRERFSPHSERGWDYPNGWAPHQLLAWSALEAHGFHEDAQRLIFSWLYLLLTQVIDYDGNTLDSYDVVQRTRGSSEAVSDRGELAASGFAWTNASFQVGLSMLDAPERARLAQSVARR